ncbi:glycosyltransferase family 2 protein [Roseibium sp. MMSF_3544]|uniref:glycosyltransferase family 2 protein n=1 Tax=unclassified Roseibium TaxID=2629323 RepID=UPI00273FDC33|nr:glycosyltransferase family 2 protein [Roseibium sp. MMSF_3544]
MKKNELAPVALFAFNRPDHTRRTLDAIAKNHLAGETDLFVFVDGPRAEKDIALVHEVYAIADAVEGFKSVTIVRRDANIGLARSIIQGITRTLEEHDRIVVLEDDIVTSPAFLNYMNGSLSHFQGEKKVWHICGYNEPTRSRDSTKTHFSRLMNCWGWGTWRDRWQHFEKDPEKLLSEFTPDMINRFNLDIGEKFWFQVLANADGRMNTWAIFWYATIFKEGGLCLNPNVSYVRNIGFDGSGVHCSVDEVRNRARKLNLEVKVKYPKKISEDPSEFKKLKEFYKNKKRKISKIKKIRKKIIKLFVETD